MHRSKTRLTRFVATLLLAVSLSLAAPVRPVHAADQSLAFNDKYVFATTRSVNDMDVNPALKITIMPVTIIMDTIFLPFALIAGFITT